MLVCVVLWCLFTTSCTEDLESGTVSCNVLDTSEAQEMRDTTWRDKFIVNSIIVKKQSVCLWSFIPL